VDLQRRLDRAVGPHALSDFQAQSSRHRRRRLGRRLEIVEGQAARPRGLRDIAKPARGDEPDSPAAPRAHRVRAAPRAMREPRATDASGSPAGSVESPFITPSAGLAGVVGTLPLVSRPDGARTTTSVKVPPTSMPTLVPAMRERLARCTTEASSGLEVQDGDS